MRKIRQIHKILKSTCSSKEYKIAARKNKVKCHICPRNRGCNRRHNRKPHVSWKEFRIYQYKTK